MQSNWFKRAVRKIISQYRRKNRRPYSGPQRYFGPMRLVRVIGMPTIVGNTMKMDRSILSEMGFRWDAKTQLDGQALGDTRDGVVNGAMIGSRELSPEEIDILAQNGVDTSNQIDLPLYQPNENTETPQEQTPETGTSQEEVTEVTEVTENAGETNQGAQSNEENQKMLWALRNSSGYADTKQVVQEQLKKLSDILTSPRLSEEQAKLKEEFLNFMSKAHNYSFNNAILLFLQRSNATMVGGAKNLWAANGREVKEGEKPLFILAPIFAGEKRLNAQQYAAKISEFKAQGMSDTEAKKAVDRWKKKDARVVGFKDVPVFDVSQTQPIEGWRDPKTGKPPFNPDEFHQSYLHKMNDKSDRADALWNAASNAMDKTGINVSQKSTGNAGGYSSGGNVVIDDRSMGERRVATLIHEWAHEVLHQSAEDREKRKKENTPKKIIEAEAESTAWLIMQAFGLKGDPDWSARYLSLWGLSPEEIMSRQENIHKAYKMIYKAINDELDRSIGQKTASKILKKKLHRIAQMPGMEGGGGPPPLAPGMPSDEANFVFLRVEKNKKGEWGCVFLDRSNGKELFSTEEMMSNAMKDSNIPDGQKTEFQRGIMRMRVNKKDSKNFPLYGE